MFKKGNQPKVWLSVRRVCLGSSLFCLSLLFQGCADNSGILHCPMEGADCRNPKVNKTQPNEHSSTTNSPIPPKVLNKNLNSENHTYIGVIGGSVVIESNNGLSSEKVNENEFGIVNSNGQITVSKNPQNKPLVTEPKSKKH